MDEQREHTSGIQEAGVGGPRSAHSPGGVQRAQVPVKTLQSLQSERGVIGSKTGRLGQTSGCVFMCFLGSQCQG